MSTFDELKKTAETAVQNQVTKQEGWLKANLKPILIGAAIIVTLWLLHLVIKHA